MKYYTYTIYFVDGYYYHGYSRYKGNDPLTDGYYGSPVTHKEKWFNTMYWKEVTGIYETLEQVTLAEQEVIRPVFREDPFCLNANCNGIISPERALEGAKKGGKKAGEHHKANKTAICDPVNQEKGRITAKEKEVGFYDPEFQQSDMMKDIRKSNGKKTGELAALNGQLAAARANIDPEKRRETCRQTALKLAAEGRGLKNIPCEVRAAQSRKEGLKICNSKWIDPDHPELGAHNPGNLAKIQRKFGFPSEKKNRMRIG